MAYYEDEEQYITGGTIDTTPDLDLDAILDLLSPTTAAVASTGEYNLNVGGEGQTWGDALSDTITPKYNVPGLSTISRTIGSVAKYLDDVMPDIPLSAAVGTATNPIMGRIVSELAPDTNVPGFQTLANFTPGIGDPETGLYSPLDLLGVGLDVAGIGLAGDYLKVAKYRKARELDPPDLGLEEIFARNQASLDAIRAHPTSEAIDMLRPEARANPSTRLQRVQEIQEGGGTYTAAVRQMRDEMGLPDDNPVLARIEEIRGDNPGITVRETVDQIQDDPAMMEIIRNRAGVDPNQARLFDENLSARLEADGIPAPPPGDLARTAERSMIFDEVGLEPTALGFDDVMDAPIARIAEAPPGVAKIQTDADRAFGTAQKRIDRVNYTDFNIRQINLFDEPGLTNNTIRKTFARQDRTDSYLDVIIESESNGSMTVRMSDRAHDTIKEDGFMHYNISKLDDGTHHITDFHFFTEGEYLNLSHSQKRSAQRLFVDFMNTIPKGSKFTNNTLTLDSLHFIMRRLVESGQGTIKPLRKGVLGDLDIRTASSSKFSGATQLGAEDKTEQLGLLFQNYQEQLIKSGQMSPDDIVDFQASTQRSTHKWGKTSAERAREKGTPYDHSVIRFTEFTIEDFKAFIPTVVGLKNWEDVEKMIQGKDETVDRVMDLEKGVF